MKTASVKRPFGTAIFERIRAVKYLAWEDTIEVEFESGVTYLVSNAQFRKRNGLRKGKPDVLSVWVDPELRSGFFVRYANGEMAEASWEFVKESGE